MLQVVRKNPILSRFAGVDSATSLLKSLKNKNKRINCITSKYKERISSTNDYKQAQENYVRCKFTVTNMA